MANGWTPQRRARQAQAIRSWQPWKQSTGPRTSQGKAAASRIRDKGGHRPILRHLAALLREQKDELADWADA